jgi:hypothetical protein
MFGVVISSALPFLCKNRTKKETEKREQLEMEMRDKKEEEDCYK